MYHKIANLHRRSPETHKLTDEYTNPVCRSVRSWWAYEKCDGMNIRIILSNPAQVDRKIPEIRGRTDNATMSQHWLEYLLEMFPAEKIASLPEEIWEGSNELVVYGELMGPKINGNPHGFPGLEFRMFDVAGKRMLRKPEALQVATHLNARFPALLAWNAPLDEIEEHFREYKTGFPHNSYFEGVVITPPEDLFDRYGNRMIFKLKTRDLR
jgi:hypothetical protein